MEIVDGRTMVRETGVEYKFTLFMTNDVPRKSKIYVAFPSSWTLDCVN